MDVYLAYIDDSGDQQLDLLSAVIIPIESWSTSLAAWLEFRRDLARDHAIPVGYELHANKFLNGRGRPSTVSSAPINTSRAIRRQIGEQAMKVIADLPGIRVITVAQRGARRLTYGLLADALEAHLDRVNGQAIMIVDGDEQHPTYHRTHRELKLADRRIIEDPWMQGSHTSQLIQAADLVAYSAHQHLTRPQRHEPLWHWYDQYVLPIHIEGHPRLVQL